ncbi:ABC transporter permease [Inquilinus sp. OTU3971]|uniref:ABC transporter permease n=1 Tax=Inquilinus sp. OTU3971 TaxID=3043855 RepID=UPI00313E58F3
MSDAMQKERRAFLVAPDARRMLAQASGFWGLSLLLVVLLAAASAAVGDRFLSGANLRAMAVQIPEFGLLSLAMMITLLKGGLNLAVVATANACALVVAAILTAYPSGLDGLQLYAVVAMALAAGLAVALLIGLTIGVLVAYLNISSIIATLGMMILLKGLALGFSRGGVLSGFPEPILFVGQGMIWFLPASLLVLLAAAAVLAFALNRTSFGAALYMIGSNEAATRYSGVNTRWVMTRCYMASSVLAFLAGLVMMGRFNSANAAYGESYLLLTILAAVLGGVNPFGGAGRVGRMLVALAILQVIQSSLNQLNISPYLTLAIWGTLLILVGAFTARLGRWRR